MEPHHNTYTTLEQEGQVSGGSKWTVRINFQLSIHKEMRPCVSWFELVFRPCRLNRPDHILIHVSAFKSHFPTSLMITRQC